MSTQCILWSFFLVCSQMLSATAYIGLFNTTTPPESDSLTKEIEQFRMAAQGLASQERFQEAFVQLDSATQLLLLQQQAFSARPSSQYFETGRFFLWFIGVLVAGLILFTSYRLWLATRRRRLKLGPPTPTLIAAEPTHSVHLNSPSAGHTKTQLFLDELRGVILDHLDQESFSIVDLATEMQLSRGQLHRKVKALTTQSPSVFMRTIRLQEAYRLLTTKAGNTSEVAFSVGIPNLAYFSRMFKAEFGFPPSHLLRQTETG